MPRSSHSTGLLKAVVSADRDVWEGHKPKALARRNRAVAAALADGWEPAEIAEALHVRKRDVLAWAKAAASSKKANSSKK